MRADAETCERLSYCEGAWSFLVQRCQHDDAHVTHVAFAKRGPWKTTDPRTDPDDIWYAYGGCAAEALMFMHLELGSGTQIVLA